jgi:hypothetical protein
METSQLTIYADWAAIVGVPISIIGLIFAFFSLYSQSIRIKNHEQSIATIKDIINLQNQYYSKGAQYHDCTFNYYDKEITQNQVSEKYIQGTNEGSNNE